MNCPLDNSKLEITERNGIEVRHCPNCHGVWLDKSELDKIVQHENALKPLSRKLGKREEKSFLVDLFYSEKK